MIELHAEAATTFVADWFTQNGFVTQITRVKGDGSKALQGLQGQRDFPVILLGREDRTVGVVVVKYKRDGAVLFRRTGDRTTGWDADLHEAFMQVEAQGVPVVVCFVHVADGEARMERLSRLPIANMWTPPRGSFNTASYFVLWESLPIRLPLSAPAEA